MRSLTERQWQLYFELADRLQQLPPPQRRAALPALCGQTANRDVAALLELHLGLKPELDRCRSGERIRNLRLAERIDSGGMGAVYRATQAFSDGIEREVAVKLIHPALLLQEPREAQRRFEAEIGTLAALEHKGIARIYDGGVDRCAERGDETLYIAMELVRGAALTDHVAAHRAELGIAGILRLFLRVCDAVAYAHRRGVVHRDLKPANILVDQHGEPRVLDFGLAAGWSRAAASAEPAELIGGTPLYMSPEQLAGAPAMPAMDVYALGAILHELLAGRRAHPSSDSARQQPDAAARLRALCGAELARIVSSALAPQAADRPPSVAEFAQTLSCCLDRLDTRWHKLQLARRCLIGKVQSFWIDGVLEHSLRDALPIEPGLALQPDAVGHAWAEVVQARGRTSRGLPPGTRIAELFDSCGKALLILGAPGAGKTTLLLQLAAALLQRAQQDSAEGVPVVFHLSTWAEQRMPLADWLMDELDQRYDLPQAVARSCIDSGRLILLLDGLDEVAPEHRAACVAAINLLRRQHNATRLAVCSRQADYEELAARLRLAQAVVIQSLTRQQIDNVLERAGEPLAGLRAALAGDEVLRKMLSTPLLLGTAALAYRDRPATLAAGTPDERRTQLFAAYAQAMYTRRGPLTHYSAEQSTHWLGWLANAMLRHHQSVFYLESMQPDWLTRPIERWAVGAGSVVLCGLLVGLVVGFGSSLGGDPGFRLPMSVLLGLAGGMVFGMLGWGDRIQPIAGLGWSWSSLCEGMRAKLALASGVGLLLAAGVWLVFDAGVGVTLGLMAALGFCYFGGLDHDMLRREPGRITTPNHGIRQSQRNALCGAASGAVIGAVAGAVSGGWPGMLFCSAVLSLVMAMIAGAHACLQHLMLRWLLWRNGCAPWHVVRFLEFAVERIFVRRVGGGYAFVHRELLEYFAARYPATPTGRNGQTPRSESPPRPA